MGSLAVAMALAYALTNGLHDAANSIAALVATGGARPSQAIVLATVGNVLGPLVLGTAVADTIAGIVTVSRGDVIAVVGAGLTGAVAWNFFTWSRGLPSSSGHALVGGLAGAALVDAGVHAVRWGGVTSGLRPVGVIGSLVALAVAPVAGFVAGFAVERLLRRSLARATDRVRPGVHAGQWLMSGLLAFGHGANDASKSVGVVAVVLLADGSIDTLHAPTWTKVACALSLSFGTMLGGWPIVRTIGRRIFRLRPVDGLALETGSSLVLLVSTVAGAPVSTTQVVSTAVIGVGAGRHRWRRIRWPVVREIAVTWLTTLPISAGLAAVALLPWRWLS
ncbi:MAG TPA: inorganic phosphate transporter [Acidimicrobiia bacterium]|nr:inorganic phosphate transporter [Acidimicrobiia bacterium]